MKKLHAMLFLMLLGVVFYSVYEIFVTFDKAETQLKNMSKIMEKYKNRSCPLPKNNEF